MTTVFDLIYFYIIGGIILTGVSIWLNWTMFFPRKNVERTKYKSEVVAPDYFKETHQLNTNIIYVLMANRESKL